MILNKGGLTEGGYLLLTLLIIPRQLNIILIRWHQWNLWISLNISVLHKRAVQLQAKLDSNIITWRWRLYIVFVPKKWNIDVRTTLHDPLAANTRPADQNLPVVYQYCLRMQLRHDLYSNSKTFLYREIINLGIWVNVFSVYWILERAVFRIRKIWKKVYKSEKIIFFLTFVKKTVCARARPRPRAEGNGNRKINNLRPNWRCVTLLNHWRPFGL